MKTPIFKGVAVAMITPYKKGKIDYDCIIKHTSNMLSCGADALVLFGSTGEGHLLKTSEKRKIINLVKDVVKDKIPIICSTGYPSTCQTVKEQTFYQELEINATLVMPPYLCNCSLKGIYEYYYKICKNSNLPVIIYNVPKRTGVDLPLCFIEELSEIKNVCAIKQATAKIKDVKDSACLKDKLCIYSGDDNLNLKYYENGAIGSISAEANLLLKFDKLIYNYVKNKQVKKAENIDDIIKHLRKFLFCESNPVPIKQALEFCGICSSEVRSPLTKMLKENKEKLYKELLKIKDYKEP